MFFIQIKKKSGSETMIHNWIPQIKVKVRLMKSRIYPERQNESANTKDCDNAVITVVVNKSN